MFINKFNDTSDVVGAAGFLQSNLAYLEGEVYRQQYPEFKYSTFVPVVTSEPEYAAQIGVRVLNYRGGLRRYNGIATDQPTADVAQKVQFVDVHTFSSGYRFSIVELNQAKMGLLELDVERALAVRATAEADTNKIMLRGGLDDNGNFAATGEGLFTGPNVPVTTATATIDSIVTAGGDVAQKILTVFNAAYRAVYIDQTSTVHKPNTCILPATTYQILNSTILGSGNASNLTVLQFLRLNYPDVEFYDDINLETAGVGGKKRMVIYKRDVRVIKGHVPMPLRFQQIEGPQNMTFYVPAIMRTAGVEWRVPKAAHYVDGI